MIQNSILDEESSRGTRPEITEHARILITGCSGYVGRQLARHLHQRGYAVSGTCRRDFQLDGIEVTPGSLTDPEFTSEILKDQDVVIHAAALTRSKSKADLYDSNERVTACLLEAAQRRNVKRLIYLSTDQAVQGVGLYGESKQNCEALIRETAIDHAILRLTPVIGEFDPTQNATFSKIIAKLIDSRIFLVPGDGAFPIAPIAIQDIADAIDLLVKIEGPLSRTYGLCGEASTFIAFVDQAEEALGTRRRRIHLPLGPIKAAASLLKRIPGLSGLPLDSILNIGAPVPVDTQDLFRDTGFTPTPLPDVIRSMPGLPRQVTHDGLLTHQS